MECKKIQKKLAAFRDGELNLDINREIQEHLDSCYGCKAVFDQLSSVDKFLDTKTAIPTNPYFLTKVRAKIKEQNSPKPAMTGKLLFPAYIAAGLLIGAFLGITAGKAVMAPPPSQNYAQLGSFYAKADVFNTLPKRSLAAGYVDFAQMQSKPIVGVK